MESANAAYGSVTAALAQLDLMKSKERARIDLQAIGLDVENQDEEFWSLKATIKIRNLGASRAYVTGKAAKLLILRPDEAPSTDDIWSLVDWDNKFIDPSTEPKIESAYFFQFKDIVPLGDFATEMYECRLRANLIGFIEYHTLGTHFRVNFSYIWAGRNDPYSLGGMLGGPDPSTPVEKITWGFWREEDAQSNGEHETQAN